jgi:hypothetical protein
VTSIGNPQHPAEPRIVTPQEAQDWLRFVRGNAVPGDTFPNGIPQDEDVAYTIETEEARTRAAVVKALDEAAERARSWSHSAEDAVLEYRDAIENGADW